MTDMFDDKCGDLADYFLQDQPGEIARKRNALAMAIQDAIDDWFSVEDDSAETANREGEPT